MNVKVKGPAATIGFAPNDIGANAPEVVWTIDGRLIAA
jgi:hypothetical protein